jgi:hypothetical protein
MEKDVSVRMGVGNKRKLVCEDVSGFPVPLSPGNAREGPGWLDIGTLLPAVCCLGLLRAHNASNVRLGLCYRPLLRAFAREWG